MARYKVKFRVAADHDYKYKVKTLRIDNPVDEQGFVKSKEARSILDQWGKDNVEGYAGTVWYQDILEHKKRPPVQTTVRRNRQKGSIYG